MLINKEVIDLNKTPIAKDKFSCFSSMITYDTKTNKYKEILI